MSPPHQQLQRQAPPQQGQPSGSQQQIPATRPRPVIDLTDSGDERVPKRPRMASDPNVYSQRSPGSVNHPQHQAYAQMPAPAPYQISQRIAQQRSQAVAMDYLRDQPMQWNYPQRSGTAPTNPYQYASLSMSPTYVGPHGANTSIPAPPVSAPPVMDTHRGATSSQGATQLFDAQNQIQGVGQPQQVAHPTSGNLVETPGERSTVTPVGSTPAAPPPDSVRVSPEAMTNDQTQGGELTLPPLTEEQTKQMRSELADSMFTEPEEGDETQARTCEFCM